MVGQVDQLDQQLLTQYEEHSDKFESKVRAANTEKQALREEIIALETEMRTMRDQLADRQTQNRAMQFVLSKEETLAERKSVIEERALKLLQSDLETQILGI